MLFLIHCQVPSTTEEDANYSLLILPRLRNTLLRILHHKSTTQQNRRLVNTLVLITKRSHTAGLHEECGAFLEGFTYPAHGEGAEDVAVAYDHDVASAAGGSFASR